MNFGFWGLCALQSQKYIGTKDQKSEILPQPWDIVLETRKRFFGNPPQGGEFNQLKPLWCPFGNW
jgi:hypothetical protein